MNPSRIRHQYAAEPIGNGGIATRNGAARKWLRTWLVAVTVFVATVCVIELAWRKQGYQSSVADSPALWKYWFTRAQNGGSKTIAFIGASRIQAGISTSYLRSQLPDYEVVQLGRFAGGSPVAVLRLLSVENQFNGVLVCDMVTPFLIRESWEDQQDYCENSASTREQLEAIGSARAMESLSICNKEVGMRSLLRQVVQGDQFAAPRYMRMLPDRSLQLDFDRVANLGVIKSKSLESFRKSYAQAVHPGPAQLDDELAEIDSFVRRINGNGGKVVFVCMPSTGGRLQLEEQYHPKAQYWDRLASRSSAICIHWTELDRAEEFDCPDESHLDYRDATYFTESLLGEMIQRRVIQ